MKDWLKGLYDLRLKSVAVVGAIGLVAVLVAYPAQAGTTAYKFAVVALGLVGGYLSYKAGFPREPEDDPRILTIVKALMMIGVALCVALAL